MGTRVVRSASWKKRILLVAVLGALVLGVVLASRPRPRLLPVAQRKAGGIDLSIQEIVHAIDVQMEADALGKGLAVAEEADTLAICRRLNLALVGNGLSLEEVRAIERIPEKDRVSWWLDYLLGDRRSADYLAERWTRATVGTNQGQFLVFRRRMYSMWLADQFYRGVPYDQIVREMVSAKGAWVDSPQVNFLTATMDNPDETDVQPDVIRLAGRTSRAFIGQRIDCLQCHRDYLGNVQFPTEELLTSDLREGEQQDFHQLAAFYAVARMENPFVGLRNIERDYRTTFLGEEEETLVTPEVPYARELLPAEGELRVRLGKWITHPQNKPFARTTVNRAWAILFGKPWSDPIDDIPLQGPFPPGMELLAEDFVENGYNLKRLLKTIVELKAFRRDSRLQEEEPTEAHEACWAVFPLTQLRPEQVAASLYQASRIKTIDEESSIISKLELFGGITDFTKAYGDRGDDEFDSSAITIPQRLLVMNGTFAHELIEENAVMNGSTRISMLATSDESAITASYLATLNRNPTPAELNAFLATLQDREAGTRAEAIEDLYWMLLNSTEFLWNH